MATFRLSDAVVPSAFNALVNGAVVEKSELRKSGLILNTPEFDALAKGTGFVANLPFWNAISHVEADSVNDDPTAKLAPRKVGQGNQIARRYHRAMAFSTMDLLRSVTGGDATAYVVSDLARLWADDEEALAIAMLSGIIADDANMVHNVSVTTGTAKNLDLNTIIMAGPTTQMGLAARSLNTLVVHPTVFAGLQAQEGNAFVPASKTDIGLATYAGYKLVQSENLPVDTTTPGFPIYTSYLMGSNVFGYGLGDTSIAFQRDELAGNGSGEETVVSRRAFVMHVNGYKCDATPANGVTLVNSEVDDATSWTRVVDRKAVALAAIKTNG